MMITYQARPEDHVVIKGSDLWNPVWAKASLDGVTATVWSAILDPSLFTYDFPIENFNPFIVSPIMPYRQATPERYFKSIRPVEEGRLVEDTRAQVFLDDRPLHQISELRQFELVTNAFMVSLDGGSLLVGLGNDRPPHGLQFEITTREQVFAQMGRNFIRLKSLTFEHCTFRWAGTGGLDIGEGAWYGRGAFG